MNLHRMRLFFVLLFTSVMACHVQGQDTAGGLLTLEEAINIALIQNFDLKIARNNEDIADEENNWGNAGRLPTVSGAANYSLSSNSFRQKLANGTEFNRDGARFQNENASVVAQWRLYNGGAIIAAKDRLEEQVKINNLQFRLQANQVVYEVITAYLNILRLERQKEATLEAIKLFEERMVLAENRFNIGVAGKSDFLQAATDLNFQKSLVIQIENNIGLSKTLLNNRLGRNPDESFEVSFALEEIVLPPMAQLRSTLDTLNPALLINKSQAVVLMNQYKEINAQRLPVLALNAGGNFNSSQNQAGFIQQNTSFGPNVNLGLAIPIFQGGVIKQQMRVNKVLQNTQDVTYLSIKNDLLTSLSNAYITYNNAKRTYELELENLNVIKENNEIAMERFKKASITQVEFRQTQVDLIECQTRMINARYLMKQAEADILVIMGKLVE
jgi:outer membrane protein